MKNLIKKIFKYIIPSKFDIIRMGYMVIRIKNPEMSLLETLKKGKVILPKEQNNFIDDYVRQFSLIVEKLHISSTTSYIYPYDTTILRFCNRNQICSVTVDFKKVLQSNIIELRSAIEKVNDPSFKKRELGIINSIETLASRIAKEIGKEGGDRSKLLSTYFSTMLYHDPICLDEALQKLLFYNALFWQMGHYHIGLGRLDYVLKDYYENDICRGVLSRSEAENLIRDFLKTLGKDTIAKSAGLIGDTGQYILLGGCDACGQNVDNDLSDIFLDIMAELRIPDPKLILRINKETSKTIWIKAIKCLMTGIGSPLIMNENRVMENMVRFGYAEKDVWNVGTSACWEPLVIGKSFDQNNPFKSVVAIKPINDLIISGKFFPTFDSFLLAYEKLYESEIKKVIIDIDFDCSPLFSLFFDNCISKERDFTAGGAVYAHHGAQVVSFPNTINALLNIKKLVFEERKYTMGECQKAITSNFEGMEDFRLLLTSYGKKFGSTDTEVVALTNHLIKITGEVVSKLKCNGETVKIGFSSPNYIHESRSFMATLDGRKTGDPFAVHISPLSPKIDLTEVLDFSSKLVYSDNCLNGNVVDFIIPPSYFKNESKLIGLLRNACDNGIFELQLNVLDKATLIDAKAHPEKYPNLIVRVWGFSAYFNDLPEEFKDNLIHRAEVYEAA